jgi:hypothetical protein
MSASSIRNAQERWIEYNIQPNPTTEQGKG